MKVSVKRIIIVLTVALVFSSCLTSQDDAVGNNANNNPNNNPNNHSAPGPQTPTVDTALVQQLTGILPNAMVETRTLNLEGSTSSGAGDSGIAVVINAMGVTITQLRVENGIYTQQVEIASRQNELRVIIYEQGQIEEQVNLTVNNSSQAVPVRFRLEWDTDMADVDLYVTSPSGQVASFMDLAIDDGFLDIDDTDGYGPEIFSITNPQPGSYEVRVNYFGCNGQDGAVNAKVQVSHNEAAWTAFGTHRFAANSCDMGDTLVLIGNLQL